MSIASSSPVESSGGVPPSHDSAKKPALSDAAINWNPWIGVVFVVVIFFLTQVIAELLVSIYPALHHWTNSHATSWLDNSVYAQFVFVLLAESLIIGALYLFLRLYRRTFKTIGLLRPRWRDPLYGLLAAPAYYVVYLIVVSAVSHLIPSLNVNQQQDIGFTNVHGALPLILTFISLVILPPLTEEIMVRGFLYSSLKKGMRLVPAALATSLLFASAHLPEGGAAGPLYIAAIDTFILSLFLIYLREKTGSLWSSITLHATKNGVAFMVLFVFHVH
jgi:membrane protease YdiL (CAAX protease family)